MSKDYSTIIDAALRAAENSVISSHGGPFGAVVFRSADLHIVSVSGNTVLASNDPTAHAEINAIRQAGGKLKNFRLSGCSIYATGQPCPMCLAAIHWARLDFCWYTTTYAEAKAIGFDDSAIKDALNGQGPLLVPSAYLPAEKVRNFFLRYAGRLY